MEQELLQEVKEYLNITWIDVRTESVILGYVKRGISRLTKIAGVNSLDFSAEDLPKQLLLDYCRYANSNALEMFEKNFQSELLELHLVSQCSISEV